MNIKIINLQKIDEQLGLFLSKNKMLKASDIWEISNFIDQYSGCLTKFYKFKQDIINKFALRNNEGNIIVKENKEIDFGEHVVEFMQEYSAISNKELDINPINFKYLENYECDYELIFILKQLDLIEK